MDQETENIIREIVTKAIQDTLKPTDNQGIFTCPVGIFSNRVVTEQAKTIAEKTYEIQRLQKDLENKQAEIIELTNSIALMNEQKNETFQELSHQKTQNMRLFEELKNIESKQKIDRAAIDLVVAEVNTHISNYQSLISNKKDYLNATLIDLFKITEQTIHNIESYADTNVHGALCLSKDLLQAIYPIYRDYGSERDKRVDETRLKLDSVYNSFRSNSSWDNTIPMKFLTLADNLLMKAQQASKDQKKDLATAYRLSAEDLLSTIDYLLKDKTTLRQLQILKGQVF